MFHYRWRTRGGGCSWGSQEAACLLRTARETPTITAMPAAAKPPTTPIQVCESKALMAENAPAPKPAASSTGMRQGRHIPRPTIAAAIPVRFFILTTSRATVRRLLKHPLKDLPAALESLVERQHLAVSLDMLGPPRTEMF